MELQLHRCVYFKFLQMNISNRVLQKSVLVSFSFPNKAQSCSSDSQYETSLESFKPIKPLIKHLI